MNFLSWGDYSIPFSWNIYWAKHFYIWSFQSGTPNPDGLIRLPGRALNFLVFGLADNVGLGYFYLFAPLVIAFVAFFFFARRFLQIKRTSVQVVGALFFALNPIFLGNLAKVGLVLAAAMLPLCLLALRATFIQRRFRYLLLYIVCINLSFLHPYTFTVNVAISGAYFLWMAWQHRAWVRDTWQKFVVLGVMAVAVNAYFLLPLASMGTVSKDVISTNITPVAVDYTALVGVSNTGDLFTGFSLSKNVFVDFAFYNSTYQNVYFFGVFAFYVILFGLYLAAEKKLDLTDKRRLGIYVAGFLALLLLAATTVAHIDTLIKFLISMPGGWAFRSPLKWQLYIPLVLFGVLVLLLNRISGRGKLILFQSGLLVTFVLMNAYLIFDIHHKILTPRQPEYFASLANRNMDGKTVLLVNNGECMDFMRTYPAITTELNQIFGSKYTQLKHVLEDSIDSVNLASYDYVLGCQDRIGPLLTDKFHFKQIGTFADDTFRLYVNQQPTAEIAVSDNIYKPDTTLAIANKFKFVTDELGGNFSYISSDTHPGTKLADAFGAIKPKNIQTGTITVSGQTGQQLRIRGGDALYYQLADNTLTISPNPTPDLQPIQNKTVELTPNTTYNLTYADPSIQPENLIVNGSLEQGLWQGTVGDCYAYDNKPEIGMRLSTADKTAGNQALELSARSHIACTGPETIAVVPDTHYLLSFDYHSLGGKYAGYYVSFDDPAETVLSERMQGDDSGWQTFSKELTVPEGASSMRLLLYAFPDSFGARTHVVHYDQVSLMPIPPMQDRLYLVGNPDVELQKPAGMGYKISNPTRKMVQIKAATEPFYLETNETYHPLWRAEIVGAGPRIQLPFHKPGSVPQSDHLQLNGTMNAWYIDPSKLCEDNRGCTKNNDGSYDFTLVLTFVPQGWFYFGATISTTAMIGGATYFIYDRRRHKAIGEGLWRWRR